VVVPISDPEVVVPEAPEPEGLPVPVRDPLSEPAVVVVSFEPEVSFVPSHDVKKVPNISAAPTNKVFFFIALIFGLMYTP
jgi:hypothetical protein